MSVVSLTHLSAIRERDAEFIPHRPTNSVADYDRRELLRRLDVALEEFRWLRHYVIEHRERIDKVFEEITK